MLIRRKNCGKCGTTKKEKRIQVVIIRENCREIKRYKELPKAEEIHIVFNERGMQIQT